MEYQKLVTEKYVQQQNKKNVKEWKRARNRKAIFDFFTFLWGLALLIGAFYAVETMPAWMPHVQNFLANV